MSPEEKQRLFSDSVSDALSKGIDAFDLIILIAVFALAFAFGSLCTFLWQNRNHLRRNLIYYWRYLWRQNQPLQRRYRVEYPIVILFSHSGRPAERCTTANLSRGGMFLKMAMPYELNSTFQFMMHLPDDSILSGVGLVRWVKKTGDDQMPRGMGVEFYEMSDQDRNKIRKYLKSHRASMLKKKA